MLHVTSSYSVALQTIFLGKNGDFLKINCSHPTQHLAMHTTFSSLRKGTFSACSVEKVCKSKVPIYEQHIIPLLYDIFVIHIQVNKDIRYMAIF